MMTAGPILGRGGFVEGVQHFAKVMAVDFLHRPAEGLPAWAERPQVQHVFGRRPRLLIAVLIDDRRTELSRWNLWADMAASHTWPSSISPSPVITYDTRIVAIQTHGQGMADADGKALSQRAGDWPLRPASGACWGGPPAGCPACEASRAVRFGK